MPDDVGAYLVGMPAPLLLLAPLLTACGIPIYECTDPLEPHHPPTDSTLLHQEGELLVDGAGEVVHLRGVNLGGWLLWEGALWGAQPASRHPERLAEGPMRARLRELYGEQAAAAFGQRIDQALVTAEDLDAIAALGLDSVRLPLNHTVVEDEARLQVVDELLLAAEAAGLWVFLDLGAAPGGQFDSARADPDATLLWEDADAQARTVATWAALARRYRDHPAIGGYGLLDEPMPDREQDYLDLLADVLAAVRANDPGHLVLIQGTAQALDFRPFTERLDENMAYEAHLSTAEDRRALRRVAGFAELATCHDAPVWVGELGEDDADRVEELRREIEDRHLAGWAFWPWKRVAAGDLRGLAEIDPTSDWRTLVEDLAAAPGTPGRLPWGQAEAALEGFLEAARPGSLRLQEETAAALLGS